MNVASDKAYIRIWHGTSEGVSCMPQGHLGHVDQHNEGFKDLELTESMIEGLELY